MGKTFKLIYLVSVIAFLVAAYSVFLEKNDFLGEVIDAKIVKTKMKNDPYFDTSLFKTDSQGRSKFRRMELSSLISDKKLGKEVYKFEIIKEKKAFVDSNLAASKNIYIFISLFMLIAAVGILILKRLYAVLLFEALAAAMVLYYDKLLLNAVKNMGLEKKVFEIWGVAESIQHFAIFGLIIFTVIASVSAILLKEKEKKCS